MRRAIVWFRNDLRLHDHGPLDAAVSGFDQVVPVFVLDPRIWGGDRITGRARLGAHRARFWLESIEGLREELRARGSDLLIRVGRPDEVLPQLAAEYHATEVLFHRETCDEEVKDETSVEAALADQGRGSRGWLECTLVHLEDLPFPVAELPNGFSSFRRKVEKKWRVREPLAAPAHVESPAFADPGSIPTVSELGVEECAVDRRVILSFRGGEASGLARVESYMFEADALRHYKDTRNGLLEPNESSKLSPWLALGCVSPRKVYAELRRYEQERISNDSTYWLVFELLWRDYFKFLALREGPNLFRLAGVGRRSRRWKRDRDAFETWTRGETGFPFVDAFMRELAATGFMSNRGRQNVASFLAKTMGIDWRWGAAYFEAQLIDYDPASNWGNWQYVAGVGTDPRDRVFNVVKQGRDYDPDGIFVKRWLPELAFLTDGRVHTPWLSAEPVYPDPIVPPPTRTSR